MARQANNPEQPARGGATEDRPRAMSVAEAGRKGGKTTAARRGSEFYQEIGRKGGAATAEAHGPGFYQQIGRKGGEARADDPDVRSGALGRKGAQARWGSGRTQDQPSANGANATKGATGATSAPRAKGKAR